MTLREYKIIAIRNSVENAVDTRAIKIIANVLKVRANVHLCRAAGLDTWYLIAMHGSLLNVYLLAVCMVLLSIYENMLYVHPAQSKLVSQAARTKEALQSPTVPHAEDDNLIAAHHQTIPGGRPSEGQHALALMDVRIRPPAPSPTPNPLEPSPWSPLLLQPKYASVGTSTSPIKGIQ